MIVYPAIDLKGGACVRLIKGDMAQATRFNDDPADQARRFARAGARWIHVVDLDGAFAGKAINEAAVRSIRAAVDVKLQLGGGIRDAEGVARWLDAGVERVVLGTIAVRDPAFVAEQARRHPARIAVGIDARGGMVATDGWAKTSTIEASELAKRMAGVGVAAIIHTDIERDGVLGGPNIAATLAMARACGVPVIASGGVSSLEDLRALKRHEADGIAGAICGRALYDGRVDLRAAIEAVA